MNVRPTTILLTLVLAFTSGGVSSRLNAQQPDPGKAKIIKPNPYVRAVSMTNLHDVAARLVKDYGPRRVDVFSPFTDNACTSSKVVYPKSNLEMAGDYLKGLYKSWGYQVTLENVDTGHGVPAHNVVATKIGSVYPKIFIDVGAHLDTQPKTPGAGDNASGSTTVVEIARVLKDYPNRYSLRYINDVGHETCGDCGMREHVRLLLQRGERIKAALMMDGIGWSILPGKNNNEVWYTNAANERIVDMFGAVRSPNGIDINHTKKKQPYGGGDWQPYLDKGLTAVISIGGTPYNAPGYHRCGDVMAVMDMQNVLKTTQQNLAVMLLLDAENESNPPKRP